MRLILLAAHPNQDLMSLVLMEEALKIFRLSEGSAHGHDPSQVLPNANNKCSTSLANVSGKEVFDPLNLGQESNSGVLANHKDDSLASPPRLGKILQSLNNNTLAEGMEKSIQDSQSTIFGMAIEELGEEKWK